MKTQDERDAEAFAEYFRTKGGLIGKKLVDIRVSAGGAFLEYWFEGDIHHDWPMENYQEVFARAREREKDGAAR